MEGGQTLRNLIFCLIAVTAYLTWSLLQEEKDTVKKLILLIFAVAILIVLLIFLSLSILKYRVNRLEKKTFGRSWKQTLLTDYLNQEMDEDYTLLK